MTDHRLIGENQQQFYLRKKKLNADKCKSCTVDQARNSAAAAPSRQHVHNATSRTEGAWATFLFVQPDWMRMAKSPISCGTSWSRMVRVVTVPTVEPTRKDAPMARPSVKLWMKSAARLR